MNVTKPAAAASEGGGAAEAAAPTTITNLVGDFARSASTEDWEAIQSKFFWLDFRPLKNQGLYGYNRTAVNRG